MAATGQPNPVRFGFLGICEGAMLGVFLGWWLQTHTQPPWIYFGAGIGAAGLYYLLLNAAHGSAMSAPIVILSMMIWGGLGWYLGGYLHGILPVARMGSSMFASPVGWKVVAALICAVIAYSDKAQVRES